MEKIAAERMDDLLIKTASEMRRLVGENETLRAEVAVFRRRQEATKIAHVAVERGLVSDDDFEDYVENLEQSGTDLGQAEQLLRTVPAGRPFGVASTEHEKMASDGGMDPLTAYLSSNIA